MRGMHSEILEGKGPPLILLHGWGQSSRDTRALGLLLKEVATPHLLDLPGFGRSPCPSQPYSSFDYASEIAEYCEKKNIEKTDILGHSFGGKVAMSTAISSPKLVGKLILLASTGVRIRRSNPLLSWAARGVRLLDAMVGTEFFERRFVPRFGSSDYKKAEGVMRQILVKTVSEDLSRQIAEIKAETLILWGGRDSATPPLMAERLHQLIEPSQRLLFPHHDHQLLEDTGSHLMASKIIPFLKGRST